MRTKELGLLLPLVLVSTMFLVSAGDFKLQASGSDVFTVDTSGNVNASGYMTENGTLLSELYLLLSGWNTNVAYVNNSNTFTADQQISANINITGNISDSDYITATYFVGSGAKLTALPADMATIKYQNISNLPTCGAGEHLDYDGTTLSCTADSTSFTNTNIAYVNETNNFSVEQLFDADINMNDTASVVFQTDNAAITREGSETTNITIDSSGNIIISLG